MTELIFATNNQNKVQEMQAAVGGSFRIITLAQAGIDIEIPEPYNTLEENASTKSLTIFELTGRDCFSEDTGLVVDALNGEPGVRSARYAGEPADSKKNIEKLLLELGNSANRRARFVTIISLRSGGGEHLFKGVCEGTILQQASGSGGFGYDPVFQAVGANKSFGEMTLEEKGRFSHRKKACDRLVLYLQQSQTTR